MATYRKKPVEVEAEVYKEGMEDGWIVYFSGNMFDYEREFKTKQEALEFTKGNFLELVDEEDKNFEIICEEPVPFINTLEGKHIIRQGDYIITGVKGERHPCKPDIFHQTYELVDGDVND